MSQRPADAGLFYSEGAINPQMQAGYQQIQWLSGRFMTMRYVIGVVIE
jgi:hypothetical protein